jgi:hypothetical protein
MKHLHGLIVVVALVFLATTSLTISAIAKEDGSWLVKSLGDITYG